MKNITAMSTYDQLQALARFILPEDILDNFDIVGIEQLGEELHIHLDEQLIVPTGYSADTVSSNGFSPESQIHDFPIRDRKVELYIRRRRWRESGSGKSISRELTLTSKGTRYTIGFASFLKEVFGQLPDNSSIT
ncbi:MAG TPA: hypothetical protein VLZ11_05580 [Flavobacterium sp.]|nr:hypothetical protein [Flavobacterium sp.]